MTDQLRECPFCNGDGELDIDENHNHFVSCIECRAEGSRAACASDAANAWNTRPTAVASHAEGEVAADDPQTDREALVYLMRAFDIESWQCPRCWHDEDCATMDSAYFLRDYLRDHPPRSGDEADGQRLPQGWRIEVRYNGKTNGLCVLGPDGSFAIDGVTNHKSEIRQIVIDQLAAAMAARGGS